MCLITLDGRKEEPLYRQLYNYFKTEIEKNRIKEGERLPSIRGLAKSLSLSKITVETAYQQLMSEGYIENCNRSRYRVNKYEGLAFTSSRHLIENRIDDPKAEEKVKILYDFASGEMDINGFDFALWKRYISKVFLNKGRLVGYGSVQGRKNSGFK